MRSLVLCLLGTLVLAGCGGGSSDSGMTQPPPNPVVVSASPAPPGGIASNAYSGFTFSASGGSPPYSWAVTSGNLPGGVTLSPDGTLSGTPTAAGTFAFTVKAVDSAPVPANGSQLFSVTIFPPAPLAINAGLAPPAGVHGIAYSTNMNGFMFTATGGYLPLSWTVTAGALPPGVALNTDGTIRGTPTAASTTPYSFTVTVTDSSVPTPVTNSGAYTIAISEPVPPTINSSPPPTATVGTPYSFQFWANDGLAPLVWNPPTASMGGLTIGPDGLLSGTPTTAGIFPITLTVTDALNQVSPATPYTIRIAMARPAAGFTPTGSMTGARTAHAATRLIDGRVLISGGSSDGSDLLSSAELYDPVSKTFTATGSMALARLRHSATLLASSALPNYGKVLVVGGGSQTSELFDPVAGTFTATGSTLAFHSGHAATLLQNGQVLIAGGGTAGAELYDPSTGVFTATGNMTAPRTGHTATLLSDGRVLIAGGSTDIDSASATAEIYDPVSGTFASTGSMSEGRTGHTATLLNDGTVLVTGTDSSADLFNPATGTFAAAGQQAARYRTTATLRNDGTVLIAGGHSVYGTMSTNIAQLFAPESGGFVTTGSLIAARDGHTATLLLDGSVLIAGGFSHLHHCIRGYGCSGTDTVLSSAEVFQ